MEEIVEKYIKRNEERQSFKSTIRDMLHGERLISENEEQPASIISTNQQTNIEAFPQILLEYSRLYGEYVTNLGKLRNLLSSLKSALRLSETNTSPQLSLEQVYSEIDNTIMELDEVLTRLQKQEGYLIFASNHISSDNITLQRCENFSDFYNTERTMAINYINNSNIKLSQIKTQVIHKITNITKKNQTTRKWNEYKTDINAHESELTRIHEGVLKFANIVDGKFGTTFYQAIQNTNP